MDKERAQDIDELKLAVIKCAKEIPLEMLRRAIDGFYTRLHLRKESGGRQFRHALQRRGLPRAPFLLEGEAVETVDVPVNEGQDDIDEDRGE